MSITRKQYNNLLELRELFTAVNFEKFCPDVSYSNNQWATSIGGFAAFYNVGGLRFDDNDCGLRYPVFGHRETELSTHDATDYVFGDKFSSVFYTGERGKQNLTPKTFKDTSDRLFLYIFENRPENMYDETPAEAFSDEVSAPADDTLEVYAPKPTAVPEEVCSYGESELKQDCSDPVKCSAPYDEIPYVNHAPDINDIRNYSNFTIDADNDDAGKDYDKFCTFVNEHLFALTLAVKQGRTPSNVEFLVLQNDGSELEKNVMYKVFADYTIKGHDVYFNGDMTRLVFLVH